MQGSLYVATNAVTLLDISDPNSRPFPENRTPMTVEEAIRAITIDAAWQLRMEDKVGSIEVGKYADLVVLDQSPLDVEPLEIQDIKVISTMMDGKYTFQQK